MNSKPKYPVLLIILSVLGLVACVEEGVEDADIALRSNGPIEGTSLESYQNAQVFTEDLAVIEDPAPEAAPTDDSDGDGIDDLYDNCPNVADSRNYDADGDGYGNACDADYDNSGVVGGSDYALFLQAFGSARGDDNYDSRFDRDLSGVIGGYDFALLLQQFGTAMPEREFLVPFEDVEVGDIVSATLKYADSDAFPIPFTVEAVERNSDSSVRSIDFSGAGRLLVWSSQNFVLRRMLWLRAGTNGLLNCDVAVVFPKRAVNGFAQRCSDHAIDGLSINVSRH